MMYFVRHLAGSFVLAIIIGLFSIVHADSNAFSIALIINPESNVNEAFVSEVVSSVPKENNVIVKNYNEVDSLKDKELDYIISVGEASANSILKLKTTSPVLFTFISDKKIDDILTNDNRSNYFFISLAQPVSRNIRLAEILLTSPGKIGLTQGPESKKIIEQYKSESKIHGVNLVVRNSTDYPEPIDAMRDSLEESDIYIAVYDSIILNRHTSKWLLYMAYKMNKPVIGYSSAYIKAGAVASIYSTPTQFGKQSADWVANLMQDKDVLKLQFPKYFTVSVNERIQRILGLVKISEQDVNSQLLQFEGGSVSD